jgi:acyl-CoA synthetase (AMP-forming)/AMP-acid ligase II/acyl carrier protein
LPRVGELWNVYGPTEATIWSTLERVQAQGPITIGHPLANTQVYVLDAHGTPQPIGVPGELWIAGDGLARGYLRREELTQERFRPDPFVEGGEGRMYRTGDLARWRADGRLECLGRIDNQVKLRGFRIELGEIESVLSEVGGVAQVVCVVREDTPGDQRLTAYVVAATEEAVDVGALRDAASQRLPVYMVPSAYVAVDSLPQTPNGKVDRKALLSRKAESVSTASAEVVEPRTELERCIASIWSKVLKVEQVSVTANFFDLGGHSLLLAQVHAEIVAELGRGLSIIELFQYPTVASVASHLEESGSFHLDLPTGRTQEQHR